MMSRSVFLAMLMLGGGMAGPAIAGPVSYNFNSISVPGSLSTWAQGVNNAGDVVGGYVDVKDPNDVFHGFLLDTTGHFQTIDVPGAQIRTSPQAINNSGEIVGSYVDANGVSHGFLDKNGVFKTIDVPGSISTAALGINSSGQIVGSFDSPNGQGQDFGGGFVYANGVFTTILVPGFQFAVGQGINDAGNVVGTVSNNFSRLGFLDVNGNFTFIDVGVDVSGNPFTEALAINNAGDIVGNSTSRGFLLDVNGNISTIEFPGAISTGASGINDQGVIVGNYSGGFGPARDPGAQGVCPEFLQQCGYIATPVPEPSSLGLVGAILLAFAASLRRVGRWSTGLTSGATRILSRLR
jgi:hypothetical protein